LHFTASGTHSATTNAFYMTTCGLLSFMLKIGGTNDTPTFEDEDEGEYVFYKDTWGLVNITID